MTKTGRRLVKLKVYRHDQEEIVVESYPATKWSNYLFIEVTGHNGSQGAIDDVVQMLEQTNINEQYEQIIIIPEGLDLAFYGVEEDDEQE